MQLRLGDMATIRQLRRLFEAIGRKDWESSHAIAEELAKAEAKRGNRTAARALRDSLQGTPVGSVPLLDNAIATRTRPGKLSDVVLPTPLRNELQSVSDEFRLSDQLRTRGFRPRQKLIFTGPPGCGKSLTAQALANEIGLPHFVVRFDAIIGSYLGQTAMNLRQLFRFAESTACVLLFDEIDALGKRRGSPTEVGELDRIVIALMQELEISQPVGLIIATSNIPEHLDRALWRRFDSQLTFPLPRKPQLRLFVEVIARQLNGKLPKSIVDQAVEKRSFAEAESLVENYLRQQAVMELRGANGTGKT